VGEYFRIERGEFLILIHIFLNQTALGLFVFSVDNFSYKIGIECPKSFTIEAFFGESQILQVGKVSKNRVDLVIIKRSKLISSQVKTF